MATTLEMHMIGNLFDPKADLIISERLRPHWSQAGAVVFVTFRTADSIPKEVLSRWEREKNAWMRRHGMPTDLQWSDFLPQLDKTLQGKFRREFNRCRESFLDTCHGRCVLKDPRLASIVDDSLMHFDGDRYRMGDFVIMPNHVHLLADPESMRKQFDSWTHFTAVQINRAIGLKGHFWQQEPFDHLVRSVEQYEYLRKYIAENPAKAQLRPGEYLYRRCDP